MPNLNIDSLLAAFLAHSASGRARADLSIEEGLAHELMAAHDNDERCPSRAKRKAQAIFAQQPESIFETVARLVFDSWGSLAPAARSTGLARLFRFEHALGSLDVEVTPDAVQEASSSNRVTLVLALDVRESEQVESEQSLGERLTQTVRVLHGPQVIDVELDDEGTGSVPIELDANEPLVIAVVDELGEAWRTPPLEIHSG